MKGFTEQPALIGAAPPLVSVITRPAGHPRGTAVIILGAGLAHRVGPNRMTVRAARLLAGMGYVVARFDHRGIGDSGPRRDSRPFTEVSVEETREVMDYLTRHQGVTDFVLMGICSGAETALRTGYADQRVVGVGLINGGGQGYSADWESYEYVRGEARNYLKRSLFSLDSWWRALTGRIQYRRLLLILLQRVRNRVAPPEAVAVASQRAATDIERLLARGVRVLWLQSQGDFSQDYFNTMFGADAPRLLPAGSVRLETIPFTDHTLTDRYSQTRVLELIAGWLSDTPEPASNRLKQEASQ
jgi:pimeloyl-ACP methyl ester carboxylesterase